MLDNSPHATSHKGLPIERWDKYNERLHGLQSGEHSIEIYMKCPANELTYIQQKLWVLKFESPSSFDERKGERRFDLEVSLTAAGLGETLNMQGPEDITCYVLDLESIELSAREKYFFMTQDVHWISNLASQAFDSACATGDLSQAMKLVVDEAQNVGIKFKQMHFRVENNLGL